MIQVLSLNSPQEIASCLQHIGVDKEGIKIMTPKAFIYRIYIRGLTNFKANILKQEMLSLGGDVAISRSSLTSQGKKTDCLILATIPQLQRLIQKLDRQPLGLRDLGFRLKEVSLNFQKIPTLHLKDKVLDFNKRTYIMGIINLTPDSFSGDGIYRFKERDVQSKAVRVAERLIKEGADILDIGAESTRPGAKPVSLKEERKRLIPVLKALRKRIKHPISVDTYKPQIAKEALDLGVDIINDITGLRYDCKMAKVIASYKASVVIMHMRGTPQTMQKNPSYKCLISEIISYLERSIKIALEKGIPKDKIIIDPGIGFGKSLKHNLEILKRLEEFKILGCPILIGTSRKSFIGKILNNIEPSKRLMGSISSVIVAILHGANIVRVHDVKQTQQAIAVCEAILKTKCTMPS